jgi:hypothetical protein
LGEVDPLAVAGALEEADKGVVLAADSEAAAMGVGGLVTPKEPMERVVAETVGVAGAGEETAAVDWEGVAAAAVAGTEAVATGVPSTRSKAQR